MVGRWAVALLFIPALLFADNGRLLFTAMPDGTVGVTFPASVLHDEEVRRQLTSGLTTTFLAVATNADRKRTAARVEVRYDLWDETYLVRRTELDGSSGAASFHSSDELERWWRGTPLRLLRPATRSRVDIELTVLPFSAAESSDAREWLSKGGGVRQGGASAVRSAAPAAAGAPPPASPNIVEALIGTSLQAKPLITFRWRSDLVVQGGR